jgi:putative membrane protein
MRRTLFPALLLLAAMACRRRGESTDAVSAGTPRLSDANVIAVILAANNTDLSYARLVPARARSADVKAFAQRMTTDHTLLNARAADIAQRGNIAAEEHPLSLDFRDRSAARRDVLRELEGAKFDSTYIANEVQYHTELLGALDNVLYPNARSVELKEFVNNLRPAVSAHLAHAEQLRAALMKK